MERIGAGASPGLDTLPSAAPHRRTPNPHSTEDAKDRRFVPTGGWGTSRAACTCPCTAPTPPPPCVWALAKRPTFCARPEPTSIYVNTHDAPCRQEEPRHSIRGPGSRSPQIEAKPPEVIATQYSKIAPSRPEKKAGSYICEHNPRSPDSQATWTHVHIPAQAFMSKQAHRRAHMSTKTHSQEHTLTPMLLPLLPRHTHTHGVSRCPFRSGHCSVWLVNIRANRETSQF